MCGIFGFLIGEDLDWSAEELMSVVNRMFKFSESRGKEASGVAIKVGGDIHVFKEPISASRMIKSEKYKTLFKKKVKNKAQVSGHLKAPIIVIGHSRLQTNGPSEINSNNQPVVKNGAVGIHNGIIVNEEELFESFPSMEKEYEVDTEVFLGLLQLFRDKGQSVIEATRHVFECIEGSASVAVLFDDLDTVLLASNTGSLYACTSGKLLVFASEKYILQEIVSSGKLSHLMNCNSVFQVKAGEGYLANMNSIEVYPFSLRNDVDGDAIVPVANSHSNIVELYDPDFKFEMDRRFSRSLTEDVKQSMMKTWSSLYDGSVELQRCSKCLLPETMPFISFDEKGVCNYCRDYELRGSYLKGEKALEEFVSKYRSVSGEPDVVVGFSGGRDSCFGLDYIKNRLGLHPVTFTYDWGMVNDLARRNQARVVGKLGIEHIVISADIRKKRENIRKNLKAWLKKPDLGMVPLLMAGDKQFYYHFHKVREQTGVKLFIFCGGYEGEEGTGLFKYGFCNVAAQGSKNALKRMTGITTTNKIKMMYYYLKQFIRNPAYVNSSMIDTLFAYYSSYLLPDDYLYLFHYLDWDENKILKIIAEKFNWERETDTSATWRTDDGTAAIYNYIYLTLAGFTEFDIFRSHQIREGKLSREEAFALAKEENKPRFKSIEWYGEAINFDMNEAMEKINSAPRLYRNNA